MDETGIHQSHQEPMHVASLCSSLLQSLILFYFAEPPAVVTVGNFTNTTCNSQTADVGAPKSGSHATISLPSDLDSEHDTSSYAESTATSFSARNEGDFMNLSEQNSQFGSSSVNSLTSASLDAKRAEHLELLRRRTLSSSDMTKL